MARVINTREIVFRIASHYLEGNTEKYY